MPQKIKLLIVDDEVQFLNALARRLELRDFVVTKATNGAEAIQAASSDKFDLALLDLKMPGMDGREVLRILKKEHKYLEVIILTGHGSLDLAVECTRLGAYGYVPKPYELEQLIKILKDAYEKRVKKKFQMNAEKMAEITKVSTSDSALSVMHKLKELDERFSAFLP
jgi:DNA-binding NtrC family response regulator